jgi:hypothetical protein
VVETHSARYPDKGRTVDGLKRKFKELHIKRIPIGDPHCPPAVRRAKQLRNAIIELMDRSDLNSPFEAATNKANAKLGVEEGKTRQHACILYRLGVDQIYCVYQQDGQVWLV